MPGRSISATSSPSAVADVAGMVLDGDAGKVADFLAQSGQPIEKGGLAGIGRAYDRDGSIRGSRRFVLGARHGMAASLLRLPWVNHRRPVRRPGTRGCAVKVRGAWPLPSLRPDRPGDRLPDRCVRR